MHPCPGAGRGGGDIGVLLLGPCDINDAYKADKS